MLRSACWLFAFLSCAIAAAAGPGDIPAPTGIAERHVVDFDAPWTSMTTGGAGRYIVFHLQSTRKLVLFDVSSGGISKEIDAPGDDLMMAGGLEKVIVAVPSQSIVHRYDIATLKRDKSFPLPAGFKPKAIVMGSASKGPLYVYPEGPVQILNLDTLKPVAVKGDVLGSGPRFGNPRFEITVSGDGQTLVGWSATGGGESFQAMKIINGRVVIGKTPGEHLVPGSYMLPNYDASQYFRNSVAIYGADLKPLATDHLKDHILLPCDDPQYFLAIDCATEKDAHAWICASGSLQKIAVVKELGHALEGTLRWNHGHWNYQPRFRWLPTASTMVSLPVDQKQIILQRANLRELLEEEGGDYLHVVSTPPRTASVGQPYAYKIEVASKAKKVTFKAETAPEGLKISNAGEIRWTPKSKPVGGVERIVIAVSAGEKEVFHSFEVTVERTTGQPRPATTTKTDTPKSAKPDKADPDPSPADAPATATPEAQASDQPVKVDEYRIEVPHGPFVFSTGEGGRSHLLLQGQRLTVLGPDGVSIKKSIDLKKPYVRIAERDKYYVGITREPTGIEQIDKATLKVAKSMKFHAMEMHELVLHPTKPMAYVSYKAGVEFPRYRFLVYNEDSGEGRQSDEYLGKFLAIDPGGKFLIAGYSDIYEKGHNFIFNPDRIHVVPAYGSVDWLVRYDLDKAAMPQPGAIHSKAGGNGRGVRLSPDGKRVTYLSFVGSPPHSKNLCAWDVNDFDKVPVSYAIKDKASTQEFAYHPYAPWVACLGTSGALLFDRETGDEVTTALTEIDFDGAKLHALWFAADGKALVFDTSVNEIHYLHRVPLKLTPEQQRKFGELNKSATTVTPDVETKVTPKEKVALAALHALQGGKGKPMSAKEVAKWFTDAVVVVKTPTGNGTGMLVGADGYVLTCAHCIEGEDEIEVSYRRPVENEIKSVTTKAAMVNVDEKLDLALLKIKVPFPLRTVRIAASDELASGERVYVIGNPGVRGTILDYTITEGIISSPARKINDLAYVQTSAQVNPGSSGGPMFNENGTVIGQVVLKANIEGAGFATPGDELISFLVRSADLTSGLGLRREWYDDSGAHRIDATLQQVASDSAKLKKPDGAEISIPFARLSKPDRTLLDLLKKKLPR